MDSGERAHRAARRAWRGAGPGRRVWGPALRARAAARCGPPRPSRGCAPRQRGGSRLRTPAPLCRRRRRRSATSGSWPTSTACTARCCRGAPGQSPARTVRHRCLAPPYGHRPRERPAVSAGAVKTLAPRRPAGEAEATCRLPVGTRSARSSRKSCGAPCSWAVAPSAASTCRLSCWSCCPRTSCGAASTPRAAAACPPASHSACRPNFRGCTRRSPSSPPGLALRRPPPSWPGPCAMPATACWHWPLRRCPPGTSRERPAPRTTRRPPASPQALRCAAPRRPRRRARPPPPPPICRARGRGGRSSAGHP
mmetsp:Transcript_34832/g.104168  ORF Transcript_34832/g.104168 Transcript_34832/m.104168 type:complete len:310 (-) Transcript_34832:170-1099(-)